jgi:hypothetical protein
MYRHEQTYKLPMELEQIDPLGLKPPTPLGDVCLHGFSGGFHRMEYAVLCCGENIFSKRVRCEELALRKHSVSLQ